MRRASIVNGRFTRFTMNHHGLCSVGARNDLDEAHQRHRVEEVEPEDPLAVGGSGVGDGRDGQRARVRREDRVGRCLRVERPEDRLLEPEVLERRLHDQRGLGRQAVEGVGVAEAADPAVDPVLDRVGIEIELGRTPRQTLADARARPLDGLWIDVVDHDFPAVLESDLGDPRPHDSRADDPDDRHTGFIASNG
jgi:hypothetical protein